MRPPIMSKGVILTDNTTCNVNMTPSIGIQPDPSVLKQTPLIWLISKTCEYTNGNALGTIDELYLWCVWKPIWVPPIHQAEIG